MPGSHIGATIRLPCFQSQLKGFVMRVRYLAAITGLVFALSTPAMAEIPGAYGMWGDVPRSKPGSSGGFGMFAPKKKQKPGVEQAMFGPGSVKPQFSGKPTALLQGGGKPAIAARSPQVVSYGGGYGKGSVIVDQSQKKLYYVLGDGKAYAYPVAVGKKGFKWTGSQKVSGIKSWPDWVPPEEMRQRKPHLPLKMTGGINNPLGAKAIYLGSSLYRIHGTNDTGSIGTEASSGCIRMHNGHVVHLAKLVKTGTPVHVVH
jgi:lipoprotein-anchoring transpeptidase ErfK/SrfK